MSTVSENIRYLRKLKGYTQEQFAERIGIKRSLLGAYEEARANPNEIYLDSMAEVLGVSVEHLLNDNLKERARILGAGTILKLNPAMPAPAEENEDETSENDMDNQPLPGKAASGEQPVRGAQMDLFAGEAEEKPSTGSREKDFPELLGGLLAAEKGLRLFSDPEDVPVKGIHLVGRRLSEPAKIASDRLYIIVTRLDEILFRRAFNQLSIKGTVILSSDFPGKPTLEVSGSDLKEIYEYLATVQTGAPSAVVPVRRLKELTEEMSRLLENP